MVPWSSAGEILRWWRSDVVGLSQQEAATLLHVKPTALSNWEKGNRAASVDIRQLDNQLRAGGVLAGLLWGLSSVTGMEPQADWSMVYPGAATPVWMWVRSRSPVVRLTGEWGVMSMDERFELGPNGLFVVVGSSVAESPIRIHLDPPGWCDFGRGTLPPHMPGAEVVPAVNVVRRSSASGVFMRLFVDNLAKKLSLDGQRSRELAALAIVAPRTLASFLSGMSGHGDIEAVGPWLPFLDGADGADRAAFARLRTARRLSLAETSQLLAEITGISIGKDTLRRFETDVGKPHHRSLPVALDHVLGANGHLGRIALRSGSGSGTIRFPEYWTGPCWLELSGASEQRRVEIEWGDWHRTLRFRPPVLTSLVCSVSAPLRISCDEDLEWSTGLGRRAGALSIDQNWLPSSLAAAQRALLDTERAFLNAIRAVQTAATS